MTIISQGAEAILERIGDRLFKKRIPKTYRLEEIDTILRKSRTKREIKVLLKAKELGVQVPTIYPSKDPFEIEMDFIESVRLRDAIKEGLANTKELEVVGAWVGKLHDNGIIHGDLTTSNILYTPDKKLYLIDFGLSIHSIKVEDMAVDIHLLEQALESTHHLQKEKLFSAFLRGYSQSKYSAEVIDRLAVVRSRGKNKH